MSVNLKNFRDEFIVVSVTKEKIFVDELDTYGDDEILKYIKNRDVFNVIEIDNIDDSIIFDVLKTYTRNNYIQYFVNDDTIDQIYITPIKEDI